MNPKTASFVLFAGILGFCLMVSLPLHAQVTRSDYFGHNHRRVRRGDRRRGDFPQEYRHRHQPEHDDGFRRLLHGSPTLIRDLMKSGHG